MKLYRKIIVIALIPFALVASYGVLAPFFHFFITFIVTETHNAFEEYFENVEIVEDENVAITDFDFRSRILVDGIEYDTSLIRGGIYKSPIVLDGEKLYFCNIEYFSAQKKQYIFIYRFDIKTNEVEHLYTTTSGESQDYSKVLYFEGNIYIETPLSTTKYCIDTDAAEVLPRQSFAEIYELKYGINVTLEENCFKITRGDEVRTLDIDYLAQRHELIDQLSKIEPKWSILSLEKVDNLQEFLYNARVVGDKVYLQFKVFTRSWGLNSILFRYDYETDTLDCVFHSYVGNSIHSDFLVIERINQPTKASATQ